MSLRAERRRVERFPSSFLVRVVGEAMSGSALVRNVSQMGMLVATRRAFEVGTEVEILLHLDGEASDVPTTLGGKVVRTLRNEEDPGGLWPYKVAIDFVDPQPELLPLVLEG